MNPTYLRTSFFRIYLCLSRDFVNQHVFFAARFTLRQPKTPWGMQRICEPFVLKTIIMPFKRFLPCDTRSLDLCILFKFILIFLYLSHSAPFFHFSYILLYPNFFLCILPREIFLLFLMTLLLGILSSFLISAVKGLIRTTFFFLTFIVLIQWNFPWNISANLLIFTKKLQAMLLLFKGNLYSYYRISLNWIKLCW